MVAPNRRRFLSVLTSAIGGIIALMLAVPGLGYIFAPLRKGTGSEGEEDYYDAGSWSDLVEGTPQLMAIEMTHEDGWVKSKVRHSIWVTKTGANSALVLSPICPHLGCPVNWDARKGQYACPCHASFFDRQGEVLSGPAPRGLDPLPYKISNDRFLIRWIDFRQATTTREPVSL
jgi:Rieske Fe-S protein